MSSKQEKSTTNTSLTSDVIFIRIYLSFSKIVLELGVTSCCTVLGLVEWYIGLRKKILKLININDADSQRDLMQRRHVYALKYLMKLPTS